MKTPPRWLIKFALIQSVFNFAGALLLAFAFLSYIHQYAPAFFFLGVAAMSAWLFNVLFDYV